MMRRLSWRWLKFLRMTDLWKCALKEGNSGAFENCVICQPQKGCAKLLQMSRSAQVAEWVFSASLCSYWHNKKEILLIQDRGKQTLPSITASSIMSKWSCLFVFWLFMLDWLVTPAPNTLFPGSFLKLHQRSSWRFISENHLCETKVIHM